MLAREALKRLAVLGVVAAVVVAGVGLAPALLSGDDGGDPSPNLSEYRADSVAPEPIPARGSPNPDASLGDGSGVVVFDTAHTNGFDRATITPLAAALSQVGYSVRYHEGGDLNDSLADADAFVVIDPGSGYDDEEVDAVRAFTEAGGRLLVVGEPTRVRIQAGVAGVSVTDEHSELTTLASAYDLTFRTSYLYNLRRNDGNYRHVLATAGPEADISDVDRTAFYTATTVTGPEATTVLQTVPSTHLSEGDASGRFPVAVRQGNVLAVGDKTFLRPGLHNVADNEAFIAYVVEFLVSGDREPLPEEEPTNSTAS